MEIGTAVFPETADLTQGLKCLLADLNEPVEIITREEFPDSSTFPVEIISCRIGERLTLQLFAKYLAGKGPNNLGHRGGVLYEADVYAQVLSRMQLKTCRYYGQYEFRHLNETVMLLEYLGPDLRFVKSEDPEAFQKAAAWVGRFHALQASVAPEFMTIYDQHYYMVWADRFKALSGPYRSACKWLDDLLTFFTDHIQMLTGGPQTVIHGEYYPKNILLKDGQIYPVDWESAAIAPGELDLASLTEGWDDKSVSNAVQAYCDARWPADAQPDQAFRRRLLLARIYFFLWWWPDNIDPASWHNDAYEYNWAFTLAAEAGITEA